MNMVDMIIKKRDGKILSKEEIDFFVKGVINDTLPDYQISAMLMAIFFSSLTEEETAQLTLSMSGDTFDLSSIPGIKIDKHSTGGVSDTTTLILAPLVASLGVPVIKMSGRGLGFSGGTLDKLESIPGFCVSIDEKQALKYALKSNIVLMSQTQRIAPADKKLYALRDVTGTVESLPLIAASIMSKKIAAGADAIVLDVKCGSGAFMKNLEDAKHLAHVMVSIGRQVNKKITAVISSMSQPLGQNIGNCLEVIEAIETLKGNSAGALLEVSLVLGENMLLLAQICDTQKKARQLLIENIKNGKGLEKLEELICQQKGNPSVLYDYSLFEKAPHKLCLKASKTGFIQSIQTEQIGKACLETGAGRQYKEQKIDLGAGIILKKRIGDKIEKGEMISEIFSSSPAQSQNAARLIENAISIGTEKIETEPLILDIIK